MAESNDNLVAATLAASVADRMTRDRAVPDVPQALVDLYLDLKGRLRAAAKGKPLKITDEDLARSRSPARRRT